MRLISIEDVVKVSICWTVDHVIKNTLKFRRDARVSRVRIFRISENRDFLDLTNVSYTAFYADAHCGNVECLGRSK